MHRTAFVYNIEALLEINGMDLSILNFIAALHYDAACKNAFRVGGFGYGWIACFLKKDESLLDLDLDFECITVDMAARTLEVQVSSRQIGILRKCLELLSVAMDVGKLSGAHTTYTASLGAALAQAFDEIQAESRRLHQ